MKIIKCSYGFLIFFMMDHFFVLPPIFYILDYDPLVCLSLNVNIFITIYFLVFSLIINMFEIITCLRCLYLVTS